MSVYSTICYSTDCLTNSTGVVSRPIQDVLVLNYTEVSSGYLINNNHNHNGQ